MMEQIVYDPRGQLLTGTLMDYAIPRADDMPPVTIEKMRTPSPRNPLGAKGLGEAGCIAIPPADRERHGGRAGAVRREPRGHAADAGEALANDAAVLSQGELVQIDTQVLKPDAMYKLMIGCVVPRPIAWVSTVDAEGVANLAPFSYFMAITHDPPTIAFSSSPRAEYAGVPGKKDTLRNVEITREFVVNLVDDALAEAMNVTSGDYPPEVDEFAQAGLVTAPSVKVKAAAGGRRADQHGVPPAADRPDRQSPSHLVIGRIVHLHLRDDVYDAASGRIDMHRLRPVGRLAGNLYSHIHDIFEMKRPSVDYKG